jgi:hypothetical protein
MQVRAGGGQQSPYHEQLTAAQEAAETQKLGVWTQVSRMIVVHGLSSEHFSMPGVTLLHQEVHVTTADAHCSMYRTARQSLRQCGRSQSMQRAHVS